MELKDIDTLAELARLDIPTSEKEAVLKDLTAILGYIGQIDEVVVTQSERTIPDLRNVMRADENPTETDTYKDKIIAEMPESQDGFLKVKQIL